MTSNVLKVAVSFLVIGGVLYRFGVTGWGLVFGYLLIIGAVVGGIVIFARMKRDDGHLEELGEEWENGGGEHSHFDDENNDYENVDRRENVDYYGNDTDEYTHHDNATPYTYTSQRESSHRGQTVPRVTPEILRPLAKTIEARVENEPDAFFEHLSDVWGGLQDYPDDSIETVMLLQSSTAVQLEGLQFAGQSEGSKNKRRQFMKAVLSEGDFPQGVGKKELIDAFHLALRQGSAVNKYLPQQGNVEEFVSAQVCILATLLRQFNVSAVESLKNGMRLSGG